MTMKRNMIFKKLLIAAILVLTTSMCYAQKVSSVELMDALYTLKGLNDHMSKKDALRLLQTEADKGNSFVMNAVGVAYMHGIGANVDSSKAVYYLDKAGETGNPEAYHNLGMMYKDAHAGVKQNFSKADYWFDKGVERGSVMCCYDLGFMKYKGLGCNQDYKKALDLFQNAADRDIPQALYMLGLCYRNGYGVEQDMDRASFYLERASKLGYYDAIVELKRENPENYLNESVSDSITKKAIPYEMPEINIAVNDTSGIAGMYKGYVAMYDWSGKYILGEKPVALQLSKNKDNVTGIFTINNQNVSLRGTIDADGNIKFDDNNLKLAERYATADEVDYRLERAQVEVWPNTISGEIRLYSKLLREPERPMYIELEKAGARNNSSVAIEKEKADSYIAVAPNPFVDTFNARFELAEDANNVQARFFNSMGTLEQVINLGNLPKGKHVVKLSPVLRNGMYVLNIKAGNHVKRTIITKKNN